ncbi:MAG: long-chain fatty acid--CoA ligase, partial [Lentimicrobium sp.]|nr:long-chain fatty acid--CoA ligase [Lentimicrobium sp.]
MLKHQGEKIAISYGQEKISYSELHYKIGLFADQITAGEGKNIVIFSENRPGW